jgi:hypothetical protein
MGVILFFLFSTAQIHLAYFGAGWKKKIPDQKSTMGFVKMAITSCLP